MFILHRFVKHPEFIKTGQRLVFREGRTKAVGNVSKIIPYIPATVGKDQKSKSHQVGKQLSNFLIRTLFSSRSVEMERNGRRGIQMDWDQFTNLPLLKLEFN